LLTDAKPISVGAIRRTASVTGSTGWGRSWPLRRSRD